MISLTYNQSNTPGSSKEPMINFTSLCSGAAALSMWPGTSDHLDLPMLSSSGPGTSSRSFHGCANCSSQGLCTKPSRMISGRGWRGTRAQLSSPQPPPCCLSSQSATAEEGIHRRWPRSRSPCGSVDLPPSGTAPRRPGTGGCFSRADKKTDGIYLLKLLFSIVKMELKVMPKGRDAPSWQMGLSAASLTLQTHSSSGVQHTP